MKNFTILVNSSDGFTDCWDPFFFLLHTYWPNCNYNIVLNTEKEEYAYPNLKITSSKVGFNNDGSRMSWSKCLIKSLDLVNTPLVLYFQEDYFLESAVNVSFVERAAELMINNAAIKYVGLTHFGNHPPFFNTNHHDFWQVGQKAKYRISTQVGLWRKEVLRSYLREDENGWMFEIFGTLRAKKIRELFLTTNRDLYNLQNNTLIFKYLHTGIIKGRWHQEIPYLFEKHGLKVNYSIRGFYNPKFFLFRKIETFLKLLKKPKLFLFEVLKNE